MRIAIFAGYYQPHVGGYCKNIHELAKRLADRGEEIDVFTSNTEKAPENEVIDRVNIIRLPLLAHIGGIMPVVQFSPQQLRMPPHDVVVTQTRFFPTTLVGALYARVRGIPLIHVERGSLHTILPNPTLTKAARSYDHTIGKSVMKQATYTVGISRAASAFIRHLYPQASPQTIHNGIMIPEKMHSSNGFGEPTIIYTGRLVYAKGVQDLIAAFDRLARDNVRLLIIGDGPYRQKLEEQVDGLRLHKRLKVKFLGEIPQSDILEKLLEADIFVNPSYSEGLPTTVMEAASVGLPIAATDVGGTNEIIESGYSGILLEPHNITQMYRALEALLQYTNKSALMGQRARAIAHTFSWKEITRTWIDLLHNVERDYRNKKAGVTVGGK